MQWRYIVRLELVDASLGPVTVRAHKMRTFAGGKTIADDGRTISGVEPTLTARAPVQQFVTHVPLKVSTVCPMLQYTVCVYCMPCVYCIDT